MPEFLAAMPGDVTLTKMHENGGKTTSMMLWYAQVYTGQLESLLGRWASGDYEVLQVSRDYLPTHVPIHGRPPRPYHSLVQRDSQWHMKT